MASTLVVELVEPLLPVGRQRLMEFAEKLGQQALVLDSQVLDA